MHAFSSYMAGFDYPTDDYKLLQIKEKNFIDKFKPTLNRTQLYMPTDTENHSEKKIHSQLNFMAYQLS